MLPVRHFNTPVIRLLVTGALSLATALLVISALLLMTTRARADSEAFFVAAPHQATLLYVQPVNRQQGLTTAILETLTPTISGGGFQSPELFPTNLPVGQSQPLPDWVLALQQGGNEISPAAETISVVLSALSTSAADGSTVFGGQTVVYTLTVTNNSTSQTANNIAVVNIPPVNTEALDLQCSGGCVKATTVISYPVNPFQPCPPACGLIEYVNQVTWPLFSLGPGASTQRVFTINYPCRAEGITLTDQAFANSSLGPASASKNTTVVFSSIQPGLTDQPSWCSSQLRGVFDLDWGDFDLDGDLDLALGAGGGVFIFQNTNGLLTKYWNNTRSTYGVRWVDINNDGDLELVAVGGGTTNYSYNQIGAGAFTETAWTSTNGELFRVQPGNFDNTTALELAVSTNSGFGGVHLYRDSGGGNFQNVGTLQSGKTSAALTPADFNNDGFLDLAIHQFPAPGPARVLINTGTGLIATNYITIEASIDNPVYDFSAGDYNGDGFLDLAAAINLGREIRIYQNNGGTGFTKVKTIPINTTLSWGKPLSVDWGDFNGDGRLDLAIDSPIPTVYQYQNNDFVQLPNYTLPSNAVFPTVFLWRTRGADTNNDGTIDFSFSNAQGQSQIFVSFSPFLSRSLAPIGSFRTNSVDWGDSDNDGDLDLLFGGGNIPPGDPFVLTRIYNNVNGAFALGSELIDTGFGPHSATFGDANGDGNLDVTVATLGASRLYLNGSTLSNWSFASSDRSLAWADSDLSNDGNLDLLVGGSGPNRLFLNTGLQGATSTPIWASAESDDTRSVAWGNFDNDLFPDFAAGNFNQPTRVYRNTNGKAFTLAWSSSDSNSTRSVAWADYDGDGDMDLAVGNQGQANHIYQNLGGSLSQTPAWTSATIDGVTPALNQTTSLAWGDWDNDGDLDLAVGNYGEKDQVYANFGKPGAPKLLLMWESEEAYQTTGVAWGDADNDGDLDLAISQDGPGQNGVYLNSYVTAAHLRSAAEKAKDMPLPHNPSYVSIGRPGVTADGYLFSSAEVFSSTMPLNPPTTTLIVNVPFKVYDPDGTRNTTTANAEGDRIASIQYEFSLDGGITWQTATTANSNFTNRTYRLGHPSGLAGNYTVDWNAGTDLNTTSEVVHDNVRFRITVAHQNKIGPVKRATTRAVSPPFRVRNLTCLWPDNATIQYQAPISAGVPIQFEGDVTDGQGDMTFSWDFGDNTAPIQGQVLHHTYAISNVYTVTLTVSGPACPVARQAVTTTQIMPLGATSGGIYLPLIIKSGGSSGTSSTSVSTPSPATPNLVPLDFAADAPAQVTDLRGSVQVETGATRLEWQSNPRVLGYRVYRSQVGEIGFRQLADVPANEATYSDPTATCGQAYFVTAYNAEGESVASTSSYYSPPCR